MPEAVYLEKEDVGATLTTWIYCHLWMLWKAERLGLDGYINWPQNPGKSLLPYQDPEKFREMPNMFDWYFVQPKFTSPPPRTKTWVWERWPEGSGEALMSLPVPEIRAYYQKTLKLSPAVIARGEALVQKYGIDFNKTIGVTWRGTDCVTDGRPYMPIETYFPFIDDILKEEPDLRIACTAEEETILDPLLARYPNAFKIEEFKAAPKGTRHNPERYGWATGYERGMQPALMVYLYSQVKHYIKNRSSVAAVASWLSNGNIVSLAHPENLGFGFDLTKAEIKGQLVPLNR